MPGRSVSMSTKNHRPYKVVKIIADGLVERLYSTCLRIEIAGSLRRQRPMVGDIELVCVPEPLYDLVAVSKSLRIA